MTKDVDLYDGYYADLASAAQVAIRRAMYDEDLGQSSWITLAEARGFFAALGLGPGMRALEVACGSGGMTCRMAQETGAHCTGIDINAHGIEQGRRRAAELGLEGRVAFEVVDADRPLPFADASFDAIFSNDAVCHIPGRAAMLRDWRRLLKPGGRVLFTDPCVVSGPVTDGELRARSSIGTYLFTPVGCNERLLAEAGLAVREVRDATDAVAAVSARWRGARAEHREALAAMEGAEAFEGLQRFLDAVHLLASERRLSRFAYLATA